MANWNISAGAIRNPIPPIVLIIALLFAGLTAYFRLPINQVPNVELGILTVTVVQPGAAPVEMETQIAQRVEAALSSVSGVDRVTTTINPGVSTTTVELQFGADLDRAVEDARDAITSVRPDLPAGIDEPMIQRLDFASMPIGYYAVRADGQSDRDTSWFIDNELSRELLAVPGVSRVTRLGGADREVRIELDPERLTAYGVTAAQVSQQVRARNSDFPAGQARVSGQAQTIRTLGSSASLEELRELRINGPDGRIVRLADLGTVTDAASDLTSIARLNGQPVVSFMVQRSKSASEVHVTHALREALERIQKEYPGYRITPVYEAADFIEQLHESSIASLIEGAILAVVVVFLFLRDWRATLIAAAAIPLATIPTFAAIEPLGFTLNMMTLIALSLVAGVLVDDAIVEIENIVRHIHMGKSPYQASLDAADEIGLAVVATTAAIVAVFLPVGFLPGQIGQFFREFGLTVAFAAFFSLVVARLITPMMAAFFLKGTLHDPKPGAIMDTYRAVLGWAIRRPLATMGAGLAVFILTCALAIPVFLNFTFLPRADIGAIQVKIEPPAGEPLLEADRVAGQMAAAIGRMDHVEQTFVSMEGQQGAASSGSMWVVLTPRNERSVSMADMENAIRPVFVQFPDYRVTILRDGSRNSSADITVQFIGRDPALVNTAGEMLLQQMQSLPYLVELRSSAAMQRPELQVRPRLEDASRLGVTSSEISQAVRIATAGDVEQNLARFDLADRQIPIRIALREDARSSLDIIRALPVASTTGDPVRLDSVADVSFGFGEATVERRDRQRAVTVTANLGDRSINPGTAAAAVMSLPVAAHPPAGVELVTTGDTEQTQEMFGSFAMAMTWGILLIYGVLVLLFRDFFQPLTIMTALPLSLGGAFLGLLIGNQPLSLFALIGLVMLMGIVTKNSILLVDFAIEQVHKGMPRNEALMEAGMKRARPIVMTTFAMAAGMIPTAAGLSVDGALRQGMGMAVIGGLMFSTFLSLVFVPAAFILVDRLEMRLKSLWPHPDRAASPHPAE
jgi:multidrug efflux pump subunit AcrB